VDTLAVLSHSLAITAFSKDSEYPDSVTGSTHFKLTKPAAEAVSSKNDGVRIVKCSRRRKIKFSSRPSMLVRASGKSGNQSLLPARYCRSAESPFGPPTGKTPPRFKMRHWRVGDLNRAWKERLQRPLSRLRCALQFLACSRRFLLRLKPQRRKQSPAAVSARFLCR
jgi:hypothetical protein